MASVYEAVHEILLRRVAIKILNLNLSTRREIQERFLNEARIMAALEHPNITRVIDYVDDPQRLSIVMDLLQGENLSMRIKRLGPLSEGAFDRIFKQTLDALNYAHSKGVIHRDIKPSNIFLLADDAVRILDFGIAKLFGQNSELTLTGHQIGTPIYMSPEQVKSDKTIDPRSDIYSLGVTMYFAMHGRAPYDAETDSMFEILNKIMFEPIQATTTNNRIRAMITKACKKDRSLRFQDCRTWLESFDLAGPQVANETTKSIEEDETHIHRSTITISGREYDPNIQQNGHPQQKYILDKNEHTLDDRKPAKFRPLILNSESANQWEPPKDPIERFGFEIGKILPRYIFFIIFVVFLLIMIILQN